MKRNILRYERPTVELLGGVEVFFDRVLRQKPDLRRCMDWRARKIKEFIDAHPVEARRNLDAVCNSSNYQCPVARLVGCSSYRLESASESMQETVAYLLR